MAIPIQYCKVNNNNNNKIREKKEKKCITKKNEIKTRYNALHAQSLSHVKLCATPWTVACQVPLPM